MASDASGSPIEVPLGNILETLRSGRRAPNTSISHIHNHVSSLEARSQQLKDDISRLALLITQKEGEIASTETEIAQTKSLLAPIRSIPPEILLHIFSLVGGSLSPRSTPCTLGHLCKSWRSLSRSSPSLWSNIDFDFTQSHPYYPDNVLNQHLILSSPRPLDISLFFLSVHNADCRKAVVTMFDRLSVHVSRWRSLAIYGPAFAIELLSRYFDGFELSSLASLKISYNQTNPPLTVDTCDVTLPPSLRTLNMNLPFDTFRTMNVHWSALTSFTGPFSGPASFYRFIAMTRQLVSLHVTYIGEVESDSEGSDCGQLVVHESIRCLTLNVSCSMSPVLDKTSFPNVDELKLSGGGDYETRSDAAGLPRSNGEALLCRLVERSQCTPKKLFLDCEVTPSHLMSILRMPCILSFHLVLDSYTLADTCEFLDVLLITPSENILPGLRELRISSHSQSFADSDCLFSNERLQTMISSRWNGSSNVARLSKLVLLTEDSCIHDPLSLFSRSTFAVLLMDLQDNGLDVSWVIDEFDILKEAREYRESLF